MAQKKLDKALPISPDYSPAECCRKAPLSKSLRAVAIRHTFLGQYSQNALSFWQCGFVYPPDTNGEAIASKMADLELVIVPLRPHDANLGQIEGQDRFG